MVNVQVNITVPWIPWDNLVIILGKICVAVSNHTAGFLNPIVVVNRIRQCQPKTRSYKSYLGPSKGCQNGPVKGCQFTIPQVLVGTLTGRCWKEHVSRNQFGYFDSKFLCANSKGPQIWNQAEPDNHRNSENFSGCETLEVRAQDKTDYLPSLKLNSSSLKIGLWPQSSNHFFQGVFICQFQAGFFQFNIYWAAWIWRIATLKEESLDILDLRKLIGFPPVSNQAD